MTTAGLSLRLWVYPRVEAFAVVEGCLLTSRGAAEWLVLRRLLLGCEGGEPLTCKINILQRF